MKLRAIQGRHMGGSVTCILCRDRNGHVVEVAANHGYDGSAGIHVYVFM